MDAVKFIEERKRMCKSFDKCSFGCPAWDGVCKLETGTYLECEADKQVEIVKEWSAAHPRKTRQSVFLEQWPEANVDKSTGVLIICPAALKKEYRDDRGACNAYSIESGVCNDCRREFWMQEVE